MKFLAAPLAESEQDFEDDFIKQLQASVKEVKESREMGARYMTIEELVKEELELELRGKVEKKLAKGYLAEDIADMLEEDIEVIRNIIRELENG